MKVDEGILTIVSIQKQNSHWTQLNKIKVAEETNQINISHITNQGNKSMITKLITEYKINKFKEIGIKYHITR